jgi:hypothetical protein
MIILSVEVPFANAELPKRGEVKAEKDNWTKWEKGLVDLICTDFQKLRKVNGRDSQPADSTSCKVTFIVSDAGAISNLRFVKKSSSSRLDTWLTLVLKTLNKKNTELIFPKNISKHYVECTMTFDGNSENSSLISKSIDTPKSFDFVPIKYGKIEMQNIQFPAEVLKE